MRFIKPLFLSCILITLVSCAPAPAFQPTAEEYTDALSNMDYNAMWDLCEPAISIDKDTFIQKYEAIFSGLGVTGITVNNLTEVDENGLFSYSAVYHTKDYGDFSDNFSLKIIPMSDNNRVYWDYSLIFPEMDAGYSVWAKTLKAARGEMFAADGSLMADNSYAKTVYMDVGKVANITDVAAVLEPLTGLTNTEAMELFNDAQQKGEKIKTLGAFPELTEEQQQNILSVPGLGIDDGMYTPVREYPLRKSASHITGYTGGAPKDKLPEGYAASDKIGLSGLESAFETQLRGKDGKIVYIEDNFGKNVKTLFKQPAEQGSDLWLTINPRLQQKAYELLSANLLQDQAGVAIVMDASNGFIEAMASYPSFDNNLFSYPIPEDTWNELINGNKPFLSRATQEWYPPGSVIKPFVAAAALREGVITSDTEFDGEIIDNKWTPDESGWVFPPITRVYGSGSPIKLSNALIHSDNIFFAFTALRLGEDAIFDALRGFGFDEAVPFDLPLKKANLINPTRNITRKIVADMGYGQADLLITPVQLAAMYTAFANGTGDMLEPILVQKICRTEETNYTTLLEREATIWKSGAVKQKNLDILRPVLSDVVRSGTGKPVRIGGVNIAGKTGTAEKDSNKSREISWFAGYWTEGYYNRLVVVMVDVNSGEGEIKFDIAKALLSP
ncbi:MAG: penicillin-binding transpeptidase domain-containing protein [Christensenellales bacterium]